MPPLVGKVEELSLCLPGDKILAWYSDDTMYHERVLIWKAPGTSSWFILTPDSDLYIEDYNDPDNGPESFLIKNQHFAYYSRLAHPVYRFANDPTEEELKGYIEKAFDEMGISEVGPDAWQPAYVRVGRDLVSASKILGRRLVTRRRVRGGGVVQPAREHLDELVGGLDSELQNDVSTIEPAPEGKVWVLVPALGSDETLSEVIVVKGIGIRTGLDRGLVKVHGAWRFLQLMTTHEFAEFAGRKNQVHEDPLARELGIKKAEPPMTTEGEKDSRETNPDARVLEVDYDSEGERFKEWRQVTLECRDFNFSDWPLDGPLTTQHFLKHTARNGGDPKRWLAEWMRAKQIQEGDRVSFEMKVLIECLYIGGTYDQLNLSGLASIEVIARRIQAIVDAYSSGPIPDWHSAKVMTLYRSPEDAISPQLRSWAARKNKEELDLAQTRAKVREGRRGLSSPEESGAAALADGALPAAGPKVKAKAKGRGRGLEAPQAQ